MSVEVILQEEVAHLGAIGDLVRVRPGYARNFLLPRGLAVAASRRNLRVREHQMRILSAKAERELKKSEDLAARLSGLRLLVRVRVGEGGRLFGSVTSLDIERLLAEHGFAVDRRRIGIPEPLKELGVFSVDINVARGVKASVSVDIVAEE